MIDRQKGKVIIECDECGEVFEGESGDFSEVWSAAKGIGWKAHKFGDIWTHECERCAGTL